MAQPVFHLGQSRDDLEATAALLRANQFGDRSARSLVPSAMQRGELVLARDKTSKKPLGVAILDTTTIPGALFIPFVMTAKDESSASQASIHRKLVDLIFTAALVKGVDRVVVMHDKDPRAAQVAKEFNTQIASKGIKVKARLMGTVKNMFGDGRTVTTGAVFIPKSQRPNLMANLTQSVDTLSRVSLQTAAGAGGGGDPAICSGCNEKTGKDKESGKEGKESGKDGKEHGKEGKEGGKEGKDKDGIEAPAPTGKIDLEVGGQDASALLTFYKQLGVQRFEADAGGGTFSPLV